MTNAILQTLNRAWRPMTINELAKQLGTEWRTVAKEVNRLYHRGLIDIVGDRPVYDDDDSLRTPIWRITGAGKQMAAEARASRAMLTAPHG